MLRISGIVFVGVAILAGCGANMPKGENTPLPHDPSGNRHVMRDSGSIFGPDGLILMGGDKKGGDSAQDALGVNRYLWRASLDTLSFLPLASADPYGGAIVTDWSSVSGAANERFKVTARVTGPELAVESLQVIVNREVAQGGGWVAAPVDPDTARKLEDAIFTRARQLRIEGLAQ